MSIKSIFAYCFQSFYLAGSFLLLFIFLPTFYNLSLGMSLKTIGLVILLSRFFDIISDIYIGYITEKRLINNYSKKNQILLGLIIFVFSLIGLYIVQSTSIYLFIFYYNLALISYSIAIIPYDSIVIDQKKISKKKIQIGNFQRDFYNFGCTCCISYTNSYFWILIIKFIKPWCNKYYWLHNDCFSDIGFFHFLFFLWRWCQFSFKFFIIIRNNFIFKKK